MPGTALLLFARSAKAEHEHKKLVHRARANRRLCLGLNARTRQIARASGLPFFHCDERRQRGDSFGERLAAAIDVVFAQGFDDVIVVGNDCLALNAGHLACAVAALGERPLVIGPDLRGGAYLIGIHKTAFERDSFADLCWQTSGLAAALRDYALDAAELECLGDVNERGDFYKLLAAGCIEKRFARFLCHLLSAAPACFTPATESLRRYESPVFQLRGPPVAA